MERYGWPGNVRELRNVVERAVYRWDNQAEPVADITFDPFESPWKPTQSLRAAEPEVGMRLPQRCPPCPRRSP
jgi:psp operon transcriptional activator